LLVLLALPASSALAQPSADPAEEPPESVEEANAEPIAEPATEPTADPMEPAAQPIAEPTMGPEAPLDQAIPGFATLDRSRSDTRLISSLGFTRTEDFGGDAANAVRLDLYGQYVWPQGYGGYAAIPIAFLNTPDDNETAISSFEVGGLYLPRGMSVPVILRGGFVLGNAGYSDFLTNGVAAYGRFTDLITGMPDTVALRGSASAMMRSGNLFFRGDAGIDLPISEPDGMDVSSIGRINGGAGFISGEIAVTAELVNVINIEADDDDERFVHFAALGARYLASNLNPSLHVSLPLDESGRDLISFIVIASIEYKIQK